MSREEDVPFLEGTTEIVHEERNLSLLNVRTKSLLTGSLVINVILTLVCLLLSAVIIHLTSIIRDPETESITIPEPFSPANSIIEYEYRTMIANGSLFTGHPDDQWEASMHNLMKGTLIRITDDELRASGSDSIPLTDGGYGAGLGVAHNLHCVKKIKKFLYFDHFYSDIGRSGEEFDYLQSHADHCLDFLRQSIMCRIDFSMYTIYWGERRHDIPTHHMPGIQKCVNWDKLHEWMINRSAGVDMLIGP